MKLKVIVNRNRLLFKVIGPRSGGGGGGGCENLTSMQIWLWNDPILAFEDRYLIVFTILYIQYDCMSNNYLW